MAESSALNATALRAVCDPATFDFTTTNQLEGLPDATASLGQGRAEEALRFGLTIQQPGYHVFVLGEHGTGRHAIVFRLLQELAAQGTVPPDLCYLHNFEDPLRPQLLTLPAGRGGALKSDMQTFIRELGPAITAALESDTHGERVEALQEAHKAREEGALRELGEACGGEALALLRTAEGFVFAPTQDGETLTPEAFDALPEDERNAIEEKVHAWSDRLADLLEEFPGWRKDLHEAINRAEREVLAPAVDHILRALREKYADLPQVELFFAAIRKDLLDSGADWSSPGEDEEEVPEEDGTRFHRYQVKLLVDHSQTQGAPVVRETNPGFGNLIGRIEHIVQMGNVVTNFNLIRAGALHRASGGYLVLDAERMFSQPYAWEGLKRALRSGEIRIEPPAELQGWSGALTLEPEAVPCALKVVLIGDRETFYLLTEHEPDFAELFKVAADFEDDLPRTPGNERYYARLLATLGRNAGLFALDAGATARLVEQGSRIADAADRLTLHTRQQGDVMREADYLARGEGAAALSRRHIDLALSARARRFGRYPERVRESILDGTTLISTRGERAGQVNGLVVVELAGERFGHPVRITATARVGDGDVVDIERETDLGGAIHSKGVLILTAFLAARYARHQPLSLTASLVFEQSYAPVEGDSASLGELCALLSALAQVPIRQSFAMTGSENQFGEVQAIGGVNEKIEGFFDLCSAQGLTGEQGVVIPRSNARHLMLREDVVAAAAEGRFHIHAVETVDQAMEILTGVSAGVLDAKGMMPRDSINLKVAEALADMAARRHALADGDEGAESAAEKLMAEEDPFRRGAREGFRAFLPFSVGMMPWALVTGLAMRSAGFSVPEAMGMNLIVFAGTAQLGTLPLISAGAPLWLIMLTALALNLRFVIFSAAMAPVFEGHPWRRRLAASYLLTDGVFAVCAGPMRQSEDIRWRYGYYLAPSLWAWLVWQFFGLAGALGAGFIPGGWSLEFMATIALMVLLVPMCKERPMAVAALVGGGAAVALAGLPLRLGLIAAILLGIGAGFAAEHWQGRTPGPGGAMIEGVWLWVAFLLLALASTGPRASFILAGSRMRLPPHLQRALRYAPAAALAALVVPDLLMDGGQFHPANPKLLAGVAVVLVALRWKNPWLPFLAGMGVLLFLRRGLGG